MYSTCLFCNSSLGRNEALEPFQVGRRLAFDASNGRLWVICRRCQRWNLTPFEERWEAIEEAERLFRATRLRIMTDNIGLARLREGLELVRIGRPLQLELACWRYARVFGKRRRRAVASGVATLGIGAASLAWPVAGPLSVALVGGTGALIGALMAMPTARFGKVPIRNGADRRLSLELVDLWGATLTPVREVGDWSLTIRLEDPPPSDEEDDEAWWRKLFSPSRRVTLRGEDAERALESILPRLNGAGGSERRVREAVDVIAGSGSPHQLLYSAAGARRRRARPNYLWRLPARTRLALEMALHEGDERRAMEGELAALERRWREAEEIAQVADSLGVATAVMSRLEAIKTKLWRAASANADTPEIG